MTNGTATTSLRDGTAEEVRALLARRRMTPTALARQMKVSQTYIWRRLEGKTAFDMDDLEAIAGILSVAPGDLLPLRARGTGQTTVPLVTVPDRPRDNRPKRRSDQTSTISADLRRPTRIRATMTGVDSTLALAS